jgi:hypothetical protein
MDGTIDAEPTFQPWYHHVPLILPADVRTAEDRALALFARKCRAERIKANIAHMPPRSMFVWPVEIVRTRV